MIRCKYDKYIVLFNNFNIPHYNIYLSIIKHEKNYRLFNVWYL